MLLLNPKAKQSKSVFQIRNMASKKDFRVMERCIKEKNYIETIKEIQKHAKNKFKINSKLLWVYLSFFFQ